MANNGRPMRGEIYQIRVQGCLDEKWADWFEGFEMASRPGATLLVGRVEDQAALHGALAKLCSLDQPLQLVAQTECPCSQKRCPRHGRCNECAAHYAANGKQIPFCLRERTKWDRRCAALAQGK